MKHDAPTSWLHAQDCRCATCEQHQPEQIERLTASHFAMLAFAGFTGAAGISALLNPQATIVALAAFAGIAL